jgi:para-nitrobenzyl esterase
MSGSNAPVVSTVAGDVRGVLDDGGTSLNVAALNVAALNVAALNVAAFNGTAFNGTAFNVIAFKGIPYVKPPQRFERPQPHPGWSGVLEATAFGPMAPQNGSMEAALYADTAPPQSEDCLTLNVWTSGCDDGARPVMVWLHGGAYVTGSTANPFYDGSSFVRNGDVVVVTVNYRLGALGFTHLADLDPSFEGCGNLGVLDQQAGLMWVRDNIAAFGGDANNVTIFGESAGGGSVVAQLALASSRGLFHKAIAQSASFTQYRSRERATEAAEQLLTSTSCSPLKAKWKPA